MEQQKWTIPTLKKELEKRGISTKGIRKKSDFMDLLVADESASKIFSEISVILEIFSE